MAGKNIESKIRNRKRSKSTWWLIPLSKWVITPVISGLTLLIPFITGVITHLLSGMSHQVDWLLKDWKQNVWARAGKSITDARNESKANQGLFLSWLERLPKSMPSNKSKEMRPHELASGNQTRQYETIYPFLVNHRSSCGPCSSSQTAQVPEGSRFTKSKIPMESPWSPPFASMVFPHQNLHFRRFPGHVWGPRFRSDPVGITMGGFVKTPVAARQLAPTSPTTGVVTCYCR